MGEGGTIIGTARCAEFRTIEGRTAAVYNLIKEGINALVVCGGDGSLTGADTLRAEWPKLVADLRAQEKITEQQANAYQHLVIVGLVGSIDNDMAMTDLTIGAPTALHRICESMDNISSTASSHSRAFVIEVMGRHCGWLALMAGVSGGADFVFIPECPPTSDSWEDEMCTVISRHREAGKRKTIVIVAEGALDKNLNPIKPDKIKDILRERLKLDTRVTTLGHTQRGGRPCAWDRILPTLQGIEAVNALLESTPETPSYMIGIRENQMTRVPLVEAVKQTQAVAEAISRKDFATATHLGSDTSLNALVDACDAIKQSASASRNRVFIVETQGGMCGYIATMGALATGAVIVYTPEVGMNLHMLRSDVKFLQRRYELDERGKAEGRLVLKSEKSSSVFSLDVVTQIFKEEGGNLFDARSASLGHTLQGGIPSPMDRARASRLSLKCMAFIEEHAWALKAKPTKGRKADKNSAAVITITGSTVKFTPVLEMVEHADMKNRRGLNPWWANYKQLAEILGSKNYFAGKLGQ
ncbi:6-phosphofructokinase, alpha subunit [Serendipita sp. 405]|nr:6-phosphofructokinase, alpha subunit [Serendipita sp. 405]